MLLKTGVNLYEKLFNFIGNCKSLFIFVPYIKLESLKNLLSQNHSCKAIIVRWEPKDLILGSSDLEVYTYCKEQNITLYRNPRIHLKAFVEPYNKCIVGSANISSRALNNPQDNNYNYEIAFPVDLLTVEDKLYFENIIEESTLITDSIYQQIQQQLLQMDAFGHYDFELTFQLEALEKDFLISSLPMSYSIERLFQLYTLPDLASDEIEINCLIHDLALYKIPLNLEKTTFITCLQKNFFSHPFIKAFLSKVDADGFIYFGRANDWIISNCSDVPIPRRWETKMNIQILFRWIVDLSNNGMYEQDRPNYSQRLYKN